MSATEPERDGPGSETKQLELREYVTSAINGLKDGYNECDDKLYYSFLDYFAGWSKEMFEQLDDIAACRELRNILNYGGVHTGDRRHRITQSTAN